MYTFLLLLGAIFTEVCGTMSLGKSAGFTNWVWAAVGLSCYAVSFALLSKVMTLMPIAMAYAIWAGVGNVLVVLFSWLFFGQAPNLAMVGGISLIVLGVVILQLGAVK